MSTSSTDETPAAFRPGDITWAPKSGHRSRLRDFMERANARRGLSMDGYADVHRFSVDEMSAFWEELVDYYDIVGSGLGGAALVEDRMPGAVWYPHAQLNFAENVLRYADDPQTAATTAILRIDEHNATREITWAQLRQQVGSLAAALKERGVGEGDVVAAVLPNVPEAIIGLLATTSLGAIWTINSPDLAPTGSLNRITPLRPKVLIGIDGYEFKGRRIELGEYFETLRDALAETEHFLWVQNLPGAADAAAPAVPERFVPFGPLLAADVPFEPVRVAFDHPLWVLFSSGTTGAPKGIVHGHGGMMLEAYKSVGLHHDLGVGDRYYVAANTSWMVWNTLVCTMMVGASVVTYDGSPAIGGPDRQFEILDRVGASMFATGAAYLTLVEKSGLRPADRYALTRLRRIMSTGSPLPPSTWSWVHTHVKRDVHLGSDSGGTDICSGFLGSNTLDPVRLGELQGPCLGAAVEAWDASGTRVIDEVGEMVVTRPMPSMPVAFWDDADGSRYHSAYFEEYPGVWRHGDWITETERGSFVVHGRSDATLNNHGVRIGTADIYAVVDEFAEVAQSMMLGVELPGGGYYMPLFVQMADGHVLTDELRERLSARIRQQASARHVPEAIIEVPAIPVSHSNKRLEVPVKRLFLGHPLASAANLDSVANPEAMHFFADLAASFRRERGLDGRSD